MKSGLTAGECVSCGRRNRRHDRTCPYCGESVWRPLWWRVVSGAVLALIPLLVLALSELTRPDLAAFSRFAGNVPSLTGFLFAFGVGVLFLPADDHDLVVTSLASLRHRQAEALLGGWLAGISAATCLVCLLFGEGGGWLAWLAVAGVSACVVALPFFYRVPWRALAAVMLLVAAGVLGVQKYAG